MTRAGKRTQVAEAIEDALTFLATLGYNSGDVVENLEAALDLVNTKHGIAHDYTGAHIKFRMDGRDHLATVIGTYRRETPACIMFHTRYFNGEAGPDVSAAAVWVLIREYEESPA